MLWPLGGWRWTRLQTDLPLGARFIDFHVEAEFGNAVYCLLRVDMARSPRGHLRRFVGNEAADRLLAEAADTSAE
jgi:hypothetical protein